MKRITLAFFGFPLLGFLCLGAGAAGEQIVDANEAWKAWKNGDITEAQEKARRIADTDEGRHLLFLTAFVKGRYKDALEHHERIDHTYDRLKELDEPVMHSYLHLNREEEADRFSRGKELPPLVAAVTRLRAEHPLKVRLDGITEIPFARDLLVVYLLRPYFPAFKAEIEGQARTVHVDTGGTFLHMGPEQANELGIDVGEGGLGFHGYTEIDIKLGIAKTFKLGSAVLENVPVAVIPTLTGSQDFIIFGTSVLEQFHSTIDYPRNRLILSPRSDTNLTEEHMQKLPGNHVEVPFHLWADHYMFARGGFGKHRSLNFFIDSGLVKLGWSRFWLRQACFSTTSELYKKWGVEDDVEDGDLFQSDLPISLGELVQTDQFFETTPKPYASSFGGVRIDGLLSHAFLKKYAWTIDFDRSVYVFSSREGADPP